MGRINELKNFDVDGSKVVAVDRKFVPAKEVTEYNKVISSLIYLYFFNKSS